MKKPIKYVKKQPTEWENILANGISDNELIFKMHNKDIKLNSKNQTKDPKHTNLIYANLI